MEVVTSVHQRVENSRFCVNEYEFICTLGQGSFGEVVLARHSQTGLPFAIKCFSKSGLMRKRDIRRSGGHTVVVTGLDKVQSEISLMRTLQTEPAHANEGEAFPDGGPCPHVARLHEVLSAPGDDELYFVLQHCDGPSLDGLLGEYNEGQGCYENGPLPLETVRQVMRDISAGLRHCHSRGVTHRDIKPDNVMLCSDGTAVLVDFGVGRQFSRLPDGSPVHTSVGASSGTPGAGRGMPRTLSRASASSALLEGSDTESSDGAEDEGQSLVRDAEAPPQSPPQGSDQAGVSAVPPPSPHLTVGGSSYGSSLPSSGLQAGPVLSRPVSMNLTSQLQGATGIGPSSTPAATLTAAGLAEGGGTGDGAVVSTPLTSTPVIPPMPTPVPMFGGRSNRLGSIASASSTGQDGPASPSLGSARSKGRKAATPGYVTDTAGAFSFLCPEACAGGGYSAYAADVWALGVVMYVMLLGRLPFGAQADSPMDLFLAIQGEELEPLPLHLAKDEAALKADSECLDLLRLLLSKDPSARPTMEAVSAHPWLAGTAQAPIVWCDSEDEARAFQAGQTFKMAELGAADGAASTAQPVTRYLWRRPFPARDTSALHPYHTPEMAMAGLDGGSGSGVELPSVRIIMNGTGGVATVTVGDHGDASGSGQPRPVLTGWLLKRGRVAKSWHRRYFVLQVGAVDKTKGKEGPGKAAARLEYYDGPPTGVQAEVPTGASGAGAVAVAAGSAGNARAGRVATLLAPGPAAPSAAAPIFLTAAIGSAAGSGTGDSTTAGEVPTEIQGPGSAQVASPGVPAATCTSPAPSRAERMARMMQGSAAPAAAASPAALAPNNQAVNAIQAVNAPPQAPAPPSPSAPSGAVVEHWGHTDVAAPVDSAAGGPAPAPEPASGAAAAAEGSTSPDGAVQAPPAAGAAYGSEAAASGTAGPTDAKSAATAVATPNPRRSFSLGTGRGRGWSFFGKPPQAEPAEGSAAGSLGGNQPDHAVEHGKDKPTTPSKPNKPSSVASKDTGEDKGKGNDKGQAKAGSLKGSMVLSGPVAVERKPKDGKPHRFAVTCGGRTLFLQAESSQQLEVWVAALQATSGATAGKGSPQMACGLLPG